MSAPGADHNMMVIQKAQHGFLAYFGNILWRLPHGFEYIYSRWQINIFKISNGVWINPWVFHLGHVLHHFGLKLGVYRPRLDHGQPVEGAHMGTTMKVSRVVSGGGGELATYRTLNFISCTAILSQNPSMANFEAA